MPALNFKAFAAGFATQAQKIEEESAKIGVDLLKKAMDDFREEAKDYKPKYEEEIRNKKEQATYLRDTLGLSDTQVKVLLDRGDLGVKDFVAKAGKAKSFQKLDDYKGLVRLAEAQEPITGFDVIDYIDSGAYVKVKAPVYVGPEGFKTSVFAREVSLGDRDTVESTKSAYIPEKGGYEGDVPSSMGATIDLTSETKRGAFEPYPSTSARPAAIKKEIAEQIARAAGTSIELQTDGSFRWLVGDKDVEARLARDAERAYRNWIDLHRPETGADVALGTFSPYDSAIDLAMEELNKEQEAGKTAVGKEFYYKAPEMQLDRVAISTSVPAAASSTASTASTAVASPTQANVPADPADHPVIKSLIPAPTQTQIQSKQGVSKRSRIAKIKDILVQEYGYTDLKKAEDDATAMVQ